MSSPSEDTLKGLQTSREGKNTKRPTLTKPETLVNSTSDLHIFCLAKKNIKSSLKLNNIILGLANVSNSTLGKQPKLQGILGRRDQMTPSNTPKIPQRKTTTVWA